MHLLLRTESFGLHLLVYTPLNNLQLLYDADGQGSLKLRVHSG